MVSTDASRNVEQMEAALRRVTLLFADIQGSTELVQYLEPEAAANLLGPPIEAMIEEVERFEGVASDRGDGIMAVFGAPSACEDHAVRACLAALAIRDRFSLDRVQPVKVRIGIHYGQVVLRHVRVGRRQRHDVFGVAAHIAARLEQAAEPGMVCLSEEAYRMARGFVHVAPLSPIRVKGLDRPIERMLLLDADQTANRWRIRAERGLARFAGRTEELSTLTQALENANEAGLRSIQISGPAGIGKSRLVHEFLATDGARRWRVVKFIGDPHRKYSAFHPISTWLRSLIDIRSSDPLGEVQRKLGRILAQHGLANGDERKHLEMMLGLRDRCDRDLTRLDEIKPLHVGGVIAAIISRLYEGHPIVVLCEDLDCFDLASQALVSSVADALSSATILLLTTSRTRVRLHNIKAAVSRSLIVAPLTDNDARQLLMSVAPHFDNQSSLMATILDKAGGNPLFLEEVANLVAEVRGRDRPKKAGLFPEGLDIGIPDQVEALIADRLSRLPKQQRRLIQACAVIGGDVPLGLASKLTGLGQADLYKRLTKLDSDQLLYETRKYPDPQFSFKHALIRDVAYNTMIPSRRREYHNSIITILENEATDDHNRSLDDLCTHSIHAQAWQKAVKYLQLAAGVAVARSSYELAEAYLNRALEISKTLPDDSETLKGRIEILLNLRGLVGANGKYLQVNSILDEADTFARQLGNDEVHSEIIAHRAHVLNTLGDLNLAINLAERSREKAQALGNQALFLLATFFLGQAYFNLGNIAAAEEAFAQNTKRFPDAASQIPTTGLGTISVLTHGTRALARACGGDFSTAVLDVRQAKQFASKSKRPYDLSFATFADGFVRLYQRDGDAAISAFHESLALAESRETTGDILLRPSHENWSAEATKGSVRSQAGLGHALLIKSDLDGSRCWLSQAYQTSRHQNRYMVQIWAATGLAFLHLLSEEDDLALYYAHDASEMGLRFGFHGFRVQALRARGLVRANNHDTAASIEDLIAALSLARALEMRTEVAHCHAAFAWVRPADMGQHINQARRLYESLNMTSWCEYLLNMAGSGRRAYC